MSIVSGVTVRSFEFGRIEGVSEEVTVTLRRSQEVKS